MFDPSQPSSDPSPHSVWGSCPADTVPLQPSRTALLVQPTRMTHLEAAGLKERTMRCRDAAIARCFGVSAAHMTHLRRENPGSYAEFEGLWLTEGHIRLAQVQQEEAGREAARHRRLRECLQMPLPMPPPLDVLDTSTLHFLRLSDEQQLGNAIRPENRNAIRPENGWAGMSRLTSIGWALLLLLAAYFAVGALYPGGWTGAEADWLGVTK